MSTLELSLEQAGATGNYSKRDNGTLFDIIQSNGASASKSPKKITMVDVVSFPTLVKRLRRLERRVLEDTRQAQPTRAVYFPDWSIREETRFIELWRAKTLRSTEAAELYSLLAEGEVVKEQKDGSYIPIGWNRDYAVMVVFHQFIQGCPTLIMPCLLDLMKVYTLGTVARLLSKYGWRRGFVGRPLDQWTSEDRAIMVELISPEAAAAPFS